MSYPQFDKIGTFCKKCRQVICVCKIGENSNVNEDKAIELGVTFLTPEKLQELKSIHENLKTNINGNHNLTIIEMEAMERIIKRILG